MRPHPAGTPTSSRSEPALTIGASPFEIFGAGLAIGAPGRAGVRFGVGRLVAFTLFSLQSVREHARGNRSDFVVHVVGIEEVFPWYVTDFWAGWAEIPCVRGSAPCDGNSIAVAADKFGKGVEQAGIRLPVNAG